MVQSRMQRERTGVAAQDCSSGTLHQVTFSTNKANFVKFLVAEWKSTKLREKLKDKQLFVASEENCLLINKAKWEEVACL